MGHVQQVDDEIARKLVLIAARAADEEAIREGPPSNSFRNPDGHLTPEIPAERTRRLVECGVMHLIEQGLLAVPDDIGQRFAAVMPAAREGARRDWGGQSWKI